MLLLAGALVFCGDVDYAVCVDIKCHLYLRYSARSRRDAVKHESAKRRVVGGHVALALEHMDLDRGLAVCRSGVYLALLDRDGRVAVYDPV